MYGPPALSIRPFNIYGPRQVAGSGAVHHFIARALRGENLTIHNDGAQILLVVLHRRHRRRHPADAHPRGRGRPGAFNIGNPRSTVTIHHRPRDRAAVVVVEPPGVRSRGTSRDVACACRIIDKARSALGYEPCIDLEEGLLRTIYWYRGRQ
ncbi:MAG: hypothetical protein R3F39_08360 [Myxococcota bacterium]